MHRISFLLSLRPAADPARGGQGRHEHVRAAAGGDGADAQEGRRDPRGRVRARVGQERRAALREAGRAAWQEVIGEEEESCNFGGRFNWHENPTEFTTEAGIARPQYSTSISWSTLIRVQNYRAVKWSRI